MPTDAAPENRPPIATPLSPERSGSINMASLVANYLSFNTPEWYKDAPCLGATDLFYPPSGGETSQNRELREARARAICAQCAVRSQCLEFALSRNEYGIWGGTTERERHALKKAR